MQIILARLLAPEHYGVLSIMVIFTSLANVFVPDSLTKIYAYAFRGCASITDITYEGSKKMWNEIEAEGGNDCFTSAFVHFPNDKTTEN